MRRRTLKRRRDRTGGVDAAATLEAATWGLTGRRRCAGCYAGLPEGTGLAADAPALRWKHTGHGTRLRCADNGHLILLHRRRFSSGFFFGCGEDDGTGEAVALSMRTCARRERGLYKDEGGVNMLRYAR
ncbi:hypothetical protein QYE76_029683 [Lolium multiflorum]|uniref:Uncharacterized protein n=1 Tax=Lolium multiflorum TaxID=4521 RepID=A0AAD8QPF1_LOLMU|nr:hypothetical protein QYE76_029683 [Lolium multiflorum]